MENDQKHTLVSPRQMMTRSYTHTQGSGFKKKGRMQANNNVILTKTIMVPKIMLKRESAYISVGSGLKRKKDTQL